MITMGQGIGLIIGMLGLAAICYLLGYSKGRTEGINDFYAGCKKRILEGELWKK